MKIINNILRVSILLLIIILNVSMNTYGDERNIKMIGHRGASALEPENTIQSFNRAASIGAWGVETDIYVLKDGNIVVFHDADVERMTNGIGEIKNMNLLEVKELNIDSGNNVNNYNNLKIPTLDEYLNCCVENKVTPVIEFKLVNVEKVKEIVDKIKKYGLEDNTIIISTSYEWIKYIREYSDKIHFQYLGDITIENINLLKKYGNYGIDIKIDKITKDKVDLAHLHGAKVNVWTVNNKKDINKLINMGVDMITSDLGF
ncbi:glycerophosphodiester phosphodiesterase family protein [Clostridium sp.]|uniref:glycerophosphodiester phosphodiesterase n=1 Tax=Clostridium sp. TaxID=1506 RepID=UPI00262959FE|nr:glycerophosphodiester phosphodiesterase family protein [Clostridium sp.]